MYLSIFLMFLLVLPAVASANIGFDTTDLWSNAFGLLFGPDIPDYMIYDSNGVSPYAILQWLIFPFLALIAILYGILTEIKIFRNNNKINGAIAILIALIAGPTGGLVWLVRNVFVIFGYYSFLIFAIILFVGVGFWGVSRIRGFKNDYSQEYDDLAKRLAVLRRRKSELEASNASPKVLDKVNKEVKDTEKKKEKVEKSLVHNAHGSK